MRPTSILLVREETGHFRSSVLLNEGESVNDSMQILLRITKMAWRYRTRLILAYISFFAAIAFALLVPRVFGESIDRLVRFDPANGHVIPLEVETSTLTLMALALLGASLMRGLADLARTYTTE